MKPDDIIEKMMRIAFSDIKSYAEWGNRNSKNYVSFKDSNKVDGELISEIKQGKDGATIKLNDSIKALDWLSNYFIMNPLDKHKKEFDNKNLRLKQKQLDHNIETDKKKLEFEEKKLNTETNTEQQQEAIRNFLEATKPSKKEVEELFKDEIEKEE